MAPRNEYHQIRCESMKKQSKDGDGVPGSRPQQPGDGSTLTEGCKMRATPELWDPIGDPILTPIPAYAGEMNIRIDKLKTELGRQVAAARTLGADQFLGKSIELETLKAMVSTGKLP